MNQELIYGINNQQGVVGLEIVDQDVYLFIQNANGEVTQQVTPDNQYWLLSSKKVNDTSIRLEGDLHYKWGHLFENRSDFLKARQTLKKQFDIYSIYNAQEAFMVKEGVTLFKGLKHNQVSILAFDIETTTLEHNEDARVLIIANTLRKTNGQVVRKLFSYDSYRSDKDMFEDWIAWIIESDPSILCGHNIFGFDLPYLDFCIKKAGASFNIGRFARPVEFDSYDSKYRKDGSQFYEFVNCHVFGREIVDTMFLAMKYDVGRKYDNYRLKDIIKHEGLEVEGREFYDASLIRFKYEDKEEFEKIKKYAEHDGDDALALFDLMAPPFFYMAQSIPKSFQTIINTASGSWLNAIMTRAYLQQGHSLPKASPAVEFEGAISFGNPGIYKNVYKLDVSGLYPSIMIEYEVFDKDKDPKAYFKELVQTFTAQRLHYKKLAKTDRYADDMQAALKIFANSTYGFLGAVGLLFNSPENAAFITRKGREILQDALLWAEERGLEIVNADTDSISFCRTDGSEMTAEDRINYQNDLQSRYPDRIKWEDDGYYPKVIVLKAKNYILYDGKKIKTKGSALKDSKRSQATKELINKIIGVIIHG